MNRTALLAAAAVAAPLLAGLLVGPLGSGCIPIARKAECTAAEECDAALAQPFNDFDADDQTFGDLGTCWANEETAKACVTECDKFVADQLALAEDANNQEVIVACGGALE